MLDKNSRLDEEFLFLLPNNLVHLPVCCDNVGKAIQAINITYSVH